MPYFIAVAATVIAGGVRLALDPLLHENYPYLVFIFSVLLSTRYGGWKAAIFAAVLGVIVANALFVSPHWSFGSPQWSLQPTNLIAICFGLCVSFAAVVYSLAERAAKLRSESYACQLEREVVAHLGTHENLRQANESLIRHMSERKSLQQQLLTIASEEHRRISQDLHDSVGQKLAGLGMLAGSLAETLREHSPENVNAANRIAMGVEDALEEIRKLAKGLLPVEVTVEGLPEALTELAKTITQRFNVNCRFDCDQAISGFGDNKTATHLYRIVQEAVANSLKHGSPGNVKICLTENDTECLLKIIDDGKGISDNADASRGIGMKTMQFRAALIGGTLSIAPVETGGTSVTCRLLKNGNYGEISKSAA